MTVGVEIPDGKLGADLGAILDFDPAEPVVRRRKRRRAFVLVPLLLIGAVAAMIFMPLREPSTSVSIPHVPTERAVAPAVRVAETSRSVADTDTAVPEIALARPTARERPRQPRRYRSRNRDDRAVAVASAGAEEAPRQMALAKTRVRTEDEPQTGRSEGETSSESNKAEEVRRDSRLDAIDALRELRLR